MDKLLLTALKNKREMFRFLKYMKEHEDTYSEKDVFYNFPSVFEELFKLFMEHNGVTMEMFLQGVRKQDKEFNTYVIPMIIAHSLYWYGTKQGHNFWCRLHLAWVDYLGNNVIGLIYKNSTLHEHNDALRKYYVEKFIKQYSSMFKIHPE